MKFLLTSAGITNKSIETAFFDLLGKEAAETKVVFIPTAANVETGDKHWLIKDLADQESRGFAEFDVVDIAAVPRDIWEPRLREANVLVFGGGNTFYLINWIIKSGLGDILPQILEDKLWVGISAGSMVTGLSLATTSDRIFAENKGEFTSNDGLKFVPFSLKPHYLSDSFPGNNDENLLVTAAELGTKLYAIDDDTAIKVDGENIEVVSEGKWREFN